MRHIIILAIMLLSINVSAQEASKYEEAMGRVLAKMQKAKTAEDFISVANTFERIEQNEKGQWLPTYYVAYAKATSIFRTQNPKNVDEIIEPNMKKIETIINSYDANGDKKALSELHTIMSMMYNARIMVNVMARGPQMGMKAAEHLAKAQAYNPNNPRVYLLQAQNLFYTPEAFGGDKLGAQAKCEKALQMFQQEVGGGGTTLQPSWGMQEANYLMGLLVKANE